MVAASKALEADPSDAMPYLVLGSALQDAGRWREATRAYQLCVKTATRGMVDECRAMLRRR
jgi:cytochrome c-type biogenesis protein CcmH/NrfG